MTVDNQTKQCKNLFDCVRTLRGRIMTDQHTEEPIEKISLL